MSVARELGSDDPGTPSKQAIHHAARPTTASSTESETASQGPPCHALLLKLRGLSAAPAET